MNRVELKDRLDLLGIASNRYSLTGELKADTVNLYENYNKWEVFYLDERGRRNDERVFSSEGEACNYIYELFVDAKNIENKINLNT